MYNNCNHYTILYTLKTTILKIDVIFMKTFYIKIQTKWRNLGKEIPTHSFGKLSLLIFFFTFIKTIIKSKKQSSIIILDFLNCITCWSYEDFCNLPELTFASCIIKKEYTHNFGTVVYLTTNTIPYKYIT